MGCIDTRNNGTETNQMNTKLRRMPRTANLLQNRTDIKTPGVTAEQERHARRALRRLNYSCGGSSLDTVSTVSSAQLSVYSRDSEDQGRSGDSEDEQEAHSTSSASSCCSSSSTCCSSSSSCCRTSSSCCSASSTTESYKRLAKRRMRQRGSDMRVLALL